MGIRPSDFEVMEFADFLLVRDGMVRRMQVDEALVRKQTFIIAQSMGVKLSSLEKAWQNPLKPAKVKKMVKYMGVEMTEHQRDTLIKLKFENKKNGGR